MYESRLYFATNDCRIGVYGDGRRARSKAFERLFGSRSASSAEPVTGAPTPMDGGAQRGMPDRMCQTYEQAP